MCLAAQIKGALILKRNQKKSQVKFSENCIVLVTSSKVYRRSVTNTENGEYPVPYLLVYKSNSCQPHFQGQKSDFSSFLVKEVKFRQIEISQKVISYF